MTVQISRFSRIKPFSAKSLLLLFAIALSSVVVAPLYATTYADNPALSNPSDSDPAFLACRKLLKGDHQKGCNEDNITHARNVATYQCTKVDDSKKADCVTKYATQYVTKAAQGNPSASDFSKKLNKVLAAENGSPTHPANGFDAQHGGALAPTTTDGSYTPPAHDTCGGGDDAVHTSISIGCKGKGNAILDLTFAIIRFMSDGVGLVLVGSMVFAGIQYSTSRANPQANATAQNRIKSNIFALFLYIFAYALLNFLVPGKFLQ